MLGHLWAEDERTTGSTKLEGNSKDDVSGRPEDSQNYTKDDVMASESSDELLTFSDTTNGFSGRQLKIPESAIIGHLMENTCCVSKNRQASKSHVVASMKKCAFDVP